MATLAFLGPQYDDLLKKMYTEFDDDDLYEGRWPWAFLFGDSIKDPAPLRGLLERFLDKRVIEEVAAEHGKGRRLYVGTTNLDTGEFVIWDMGAIASSSRPDKVKRYHDVLQAAAAVPGFFPPVYFQVQSDGERYAQMHTDAFTVGVFFRHFMLQDEDSVVGGVRPKTNIYIIVNYKIGRANRSSVKSSLRDITVSMIRDSARSNIQAGLFRIYLLTKAQGLNFRVATIPDDVNLNFQPMDFDQDGMKRLFHLGFESSLKGTGWMEHPPELDPEEIIETDSQRRS